MLDKGEKIKKNWNKLRNLEKDSRTKLYILHIFCFSRWGLFYSTSLGKEEKKLSKEMNI